MPRKDCNGCKWFMGCDIHGDVQCELGQYGDPVIKLEHGRCEEFEASDDNK